MKLTNENYHSTEANKAYMSYSQFKDFCKCPAMAMAKINGEYEMEKTAALLVGSYVDAYLDGELDKFKEENPSIFTRKGELKSEYVKADNYIKLINEDAYLKELLTGKRQMILTCNIAGVPFKAKIDSLIKDMIIDGKVLRDCKDVWVDGEKLPFIYTNRYDIQAAVYTTAVMQNYNKKLPFLLAVITKEKTPDKRVFEITEETIEKAKQEIIVKAPVYNNMKKCLVEPFNCGECDYCKSIKKLSEAYIEKI